MEQNKFAFDMHVRMFNKIAEFTYKALNEEELTEEQKQDPDVGHLVMITILRFAAKLGIQLSLTKNEFLHDAIEMFEAEEDFDIAKEKIVKPVDLN